MIMQKKTMKLSVLGAALMAAIFAAPAANAAVITIDVRLPGGSHILPVVLPNQVVQLEVWAQILNNDGNRANDGFLLIQGNMLSASPNAGPELQGDISPLVISSNLDSTLSTVGTQNNLDANADLELGAPNPNGAGTGVISMSSGLSTKFGTGSGTGLTELLLGTVNWTAGASINGATVVSFSPRAKTDGTAASRQVVKVTSDGVAFNLQFNDANIGAAAQLQLGLVPEPISAGMLGLVGMLALGRRRR